MTLKSLSVGVYNPAGLDGNAHCWGSRPQTSAHPRVIIQISTGGGSHTCGLRPDKTIECWYNFDGRLDAPEGEFESITAGSHHTCAQCGW